MCRWSYLPAGDLRARSHHTIKASGLNRIVLTRRVRHSHHPGCGKRRGSDGIVAHIRVEGLCGRSPLCIDRSGRAPVRRAAQKSGTSRGRTSGPGSIFILPPANTHHRSAPRLAHLTDP